MPNRVVKKSGHPETQNRNRVLLWVYHPAKSKAKGETSTSLHSAAQRGMNAAPSSRAQRLCCGTLPRAVLCTPPADAKDERLFLHMSYKHTTAPTA